MPRALRACLIGKLGISSLPTHGFHNSFMFGLFSVFLGFFAFFFLFVLCFFSFFCFVLCFFIYFLCVCEVCNALLKKCIHFDCHASEFPLENNRGVDILFYILTSSDFLKGVYSLSLCVRRKLLR